jgi:hypothetical protein
MIWDRPRIHMFLTLLKTKFFNMTIDKFSKLNHFNPEIKFGPIIFLWKKKLSR